MQAQPLTSVVVATDSNPPVLQWLIQSDMQEYCASFQSNGITSWNDLKALKEGDVVSIGVTKIGHKNRVMAKIQELNSGAAPAPYVMQQPVQQQVYAPAPQAYAAPQQQQQPVYAQQAAPYMAQQPHGAPMSTQQPASDKMGKPVIVWLQWTMLGLFSLGFIFFIVAVAAPGWSTGTVMNTYYRTSFDVNAGLWKMCASDSCETVDDDDLKAIDAKGPAQATRAFCILDLLTSVTVIILMSLLAFCMQGQRSMLKHVVMAFVITTVVFSLAAFCAYTGVQSKLGRAWSSSSYSSSSSAELKYGYCFVLQIIGFLFYLGGTFGVYKLYY